MAGAVVAVAAEAVVLVIVVGDRVHIRPRRHGQVEGDVIDGDLDLAGEGVLAGADAGEHAGQQDCFCFQVKFSIILHSRDVPYCAIFVSI